MSERRFVIKEVPPTGAPHDFSITLTELKKRLDHAWGAASKFAPSDTWDWDKAIEILLHGKEQRKKGKSRLVYDKETRTIKAVYTDGSKPTRKEWEEWVNKMPMWSEGAKQWKAWFLTMPGVPTQ